MDDITLALAKFAKAKAPGSDGLPIEFYVHFSDVWSLDFWPFNQPIFEAATLPESMR